MKSSYEDLHGLDQFCFGSDCSELKEPDAHADEFIQSINAMSQEPLPAGWTKEELAEHIHRALRGEIANTPPAIMQLVQSSTDSAACHSPAEENTFTTKDAIVEGETVIGV